MCVWELQCVGWWDQILSSGGRDGAWCSEMRKKGRREERKNGRIKRISWNVIKYERRDEMEWEHGDGERAAVRNLWQQLVQLLWDGVINQKSPCKSASISRLFYMGSFALVGEPSMEPSWECHDGMAEAAVARWLIGWAPWSSHVTPQWVVLTSWRRQRSTAVQLSAEVYSQTLKIEAELNTHPAFVVCCNFLLFTPLTREREGTKIKVISIGKQGGQNSQRAWKKAAAAAVKDKGTKTAVGLRGFRWRLIGHKSCRDPLTSSASRACGWITLNEPFVGCWNKRRWTGMSKALLPAHTVFVIFSTSCRWSPVDTGVKRVTILSASGTFSLQRAGAIFKPSNCCDLIRCLFVFSDTKQRCLS